MKKDYIILKYKLKRHKISHKITDTSIEIGKPKIDYTVLLGLIILPLFLVVVLLFITVYFKFFNHHLVKIFFVILFLLGMGLYNLFGLYHKKRTNRNRIVLRDKTIRIEPNNVFYSKNCKGFYSSITKLSGNLFLGTVFLLDKDDNSFKVLGITSESESGLVEDLLWFVNFFNGVIGY